MTKRRIQKLYDDAKRLHQEGRLSEAGKLYQKVLQLEPTHADSLHMLGIMAYQTGRFEIAAGLFKQAIKHNKGEPSYFNNLGNALQALGKPNEAEYIYLEALKSDSKNPDVYNNLGSAVQAQDRPQDALKYYNRALTLRPDFAQAHFNLAGALMKLERPKDALSHFLGTVALDPQHAEAHRNAGYIQQYLGHVEVAIACYMRAVAIEPSDADTHFFLGSAYQEQEQLSKAVQCYKTALSINADHAKAYNNLGHILQIHGDLENAICQFNRALEIAPDYTDALNNLGYALQQQGKLDEARSLYERVLSLDPHYAEAHNNLANILKEQGRFEAAIKKYNEALKIKPDLAIAHFNRADIKTFQSGDPELTTLENLAKNSKNMSSQAARYLHFALAKAFDDIGDYPNAFEHLLKGNALARQSVVYDEKGVKKYIQRLTGSIDRELLEQWTVGGATSDAPIFIVGMPRSGTTLIEQILSSHPQVQASGEMLHMDAVINATFDSKTTSASYPECLAELNATQLEKLGQDYLSRVPDFAASKLRFTDKLPANFFNVGLIRLILPNARIIHLDRNPLDTCLSCFSKLFRRGQEFTYELGELGRYYCRYAELMTHWRSILPEDSMLEVTYEDLVQDIENQSRRIIEYCGLDWDERCLRFYETERTIDTASAIQVRRPVYHGSIGRWRRYAAHISPLERELRNFLSD